MTYAISSETNLLILTWERSMVAQFEIDVLGDIASPEALLLSKTHYPLLSYGSTQEDPSDTPEKLLIRM